MGGRAGRPIIPPLDWMRTSVATPTEGQAHGKMLSRTRASAQPEASMDPTAPVVEQHTHTHGHYVPSCSP
eukprot:238086-Rhodomonas_salina.1